MAPRFPAILIGCCYEMGVKEEYKAFCFIRGFSFVCFESERAK